MFFFKKIKTIYCWKLTHSTICCSKSVGQSTVCARMSGCVTPGRCVGNVVRERRCTAVFVRHTRRIGIEQCDWWSQSTVVAAAVGTAAACYSASFRREWHARRARVVWWELVLAIVACVDGDVVAHSCSRFRVIHCMFVSFDVWMLILLKFFVFVIASFNCHSIDEINFAKICFIGIKSYCKFYTCKMILFWFRFFQRIVFFIKCHSIYYRFAFASLEKNKSNHNELLVATSLKQPHVCKWSPTTYTPPIATLCVKKPWNASPNSSCLSVLPTARWLWANCTCIRRKCWAKAVAVRLCTRASSTGAALLWSGCCASFTRWRNKRLNCWWRLMNKKMLYDIMLMKPTHK